MKTFGETVRELRTAQDLGLRETAGIIGISPAYLSRIERGKERPPKGEIIKALAKQLAADPDVLFRIASSTDPDITELLNSHSEIMELLRFIQEANFDNKQLEQLLKYAEEIRKDTVKTSY
tara:strand:+ start:508 stop:870 length:363 start_codon:yes stop_codon:yes gene_type:complete